MRHAFVASAAVFLLGCTPGSPAAEAPAAPGPAPVAVMDWSSSVRAALAAGEYAPRPTDAGFRVTNRAQDLRGVFDAGGLVVADRAGDGELRLSLRAWGRDGELSAAEEVLPAPGACLASGAVDERGACLRRVRYARPGLVEWWENREDGLEQGFTVTESPPGDGPLVFELALSGAVAEVGESEATLVRDAGAPLTFGQLAAWDEEGRDLPAWLEEAEGGLRVVVDDEGAVGTVTVDPLLAAAWTVTSDQAYAYLGWSAASAGDTNGDGYSDVVVGAPYYDNGELGEGRAYVYLGSPAGLSTIASWTAESDQLNAYFGGAVASAGDVNSDGYGDVVVGAESFDNGEAGEGRAFVYLGSAAGLATIPSWTAESDLALTNFGIAVASAGDTNGDGYDDVVVGAYHYDGGETDEGRAYLYLGSATGLASSPAWTAEPDQLAALFGYSVAAAGDVNADGYGDVVVGAFWYDNGEDAEGRAFLYLGSPAGLEASAAWTAESDQAGADFGLSAASAGDVNADGYGDVVVGAPYYDDGELTEGRAYVYLGSSSGLATTAAWTVEADQEDAHLGFSVASAGDVNGDGYDDVVVGASAYDGGEEDEGAAFVYLGSPTGLATTAAWSAEVDQASAKFGKLVASAGDVNGDGYADVVVGAEFYDDGEISEGGAFLYCGSPSGPAASCPSAPVPTGTDTGDSGLADTAAAPVDTGDPPDTGVLPPDTSVLPSDTSVLPSDTGVLPSDTGVPPSDTGDTLGTASPTSPGAGTGASTADTETPPVDTGLPSATTPATDTLAPADTAGAAPDDSDAEAGCGCASAPGASVGWLAVLVVPLVRRSRRSRRVSAAGSSDGSAWVWELTR